MEYDQTNRGQIWKNDRKDTDSHPDFTGWLNVEGKEYWVSAWKRKEGAAAKAPALSFSIKAKIEPVQKSISERAMAARRDPISSGKINIIPDDEEIPF